MAGAQHEDPAIALFQRQWRVYRKVVDHNYMQHREVYDRLHRVLVEEAAQPFRFLDIACGDASASVGALQGTRVASYHGIDLSGPALELAHEAMRGLDCPATLERRDFAEALRDRIEPADVAWIGQSLHHLATPGKLTVMRDIHRLLDVGGLLLLWEPTRFYGEDLDTWFCRMEIRCRPWWTALTQAEWDAMVTHTRTADFPETVSGWLALGRDAGFNEARELLQAPSDLARVYCFRA
jgi:SAM-dependent methyltransferase